MVNLTVKLISCFSKQRLDILEALEDAVGEFSDMSMTASHILRVQRDFNE